MYSGCGRNSVRECIMPHVIFLIPVGIGCYGISTAQESSNDKGLKKLLSKLGI
jgi:hypothetical protein